MDIENINRRHFVKTDMYYRIEYGLSSKLLNFKNGVLQIEVVIGRKCNKSYNAAALELANCWKNTHEELKHAIGCKAFIIDTKRFRYKQFLIHKGLKPGYDAKKGILFEKHLLN